MSLVATHSQQILPQACHCASVPSLFTRANKDRRFTKDNGTKSPLIHTPVHPRVISVSLTGSGAHNGTYWLTSVKDKELSLAPQHLTLVSNPYVTL